jgi:prepilin-type N-terminal cleavage/methylation domain-containing protein
MIMSCSLIRQRGFSLLEVLIAISILAGIMMALGPAISTAAKAASRIHNNASVHESLRTFQMFFRDAIEQNVFLLDTGEIRSIYGSPTELHIITYDPDANEPDTVVFKISSSAASSLIAEFSTGSSAQSQSIELIEALDNAKFDFLGVENGTAVWKSEWSETQPPKLVRFSGAVTNQGAISEFTFEAAPAATSPFECQFDSVSRQCR